MALHNLHVLLLKKKGVERSDASSDAILAYNLELLQGCDKRVFPRFANVYYQDLSKGLDADQLSNLLWIHP